jgi:HK97 gp10 family phage protein
MSSRVIGSVRIEGLEELQKKMTGLGPELSKKALGFAVAAGARVIRDEAKARAPVRTGTLQKSLYVKSIPELATPWERTYYIGARRGKRFRKKGMDAWYFPMVEFGTVHNDATRFVEKAFESRRAEAARVIATVLEKKTLKLAEKKT